MMKKSLKNTLFDSSRFKWLKEDRIRRIKKLNFSKAAKIQKEILKFFEFKKTSKDNPVSFKLLLKK